MIIRAFFAAARKLASTSVRQTSGQCEARSKLRWSIAPPSDVFGERPEPTLTNPRVGTDSSERLAPLALLAQAELVARLDWPVAGEIDLE